MANDPVLPDENPLLSQEDITAEDLETAVPVEDIPATLAANPIPEEAEVVTKLIVCTFCTDEKIRKCLKCERPFCCIHASNFSPNFCKECFSKVSLVIDKFVHTDEDYNPVKDTITRKSRVEECLKLDGVDWVFFTKWIHRITDEELRTLYEFHYFILKLIEKDNETRIINKRDKIKKYQRNALSVIDTTKVTTTKTKRVSKPVDIATQIRKNFPNMPEAVLQAMIAAAKKGEEENG